MPKSTLFCVLLTLLLASATSYIDIALDIATSTSDIAFNLPLTIAGNKCPLAVSLENKEEFIVAGKGKGKKAKGTIGELHVSSL